MSKTPYKPTRQPFSLKTFIVSSIGHFIMFSVIVGMAFLYDPNMLEYDFLFTASAIAALMMGVYQANYKREED
ncbi:hypothetical protein JHD50_00985 [Sulfurimonas sp. MAG313]|nr:hypothetical protein [Sulfurimonas sp. MAG313]MDF1879885.1 hypothetical protein [Sulfurimonas sp. MAG313]